MIPFDPSNRQIPPYPNDLIAPLSSSDLEKLDRKYTESFTFTAGDVYDP